MTIHLRWRTVAPIVGVFALVLCQSPRPTPTDLEERYQDRPPGGTERPGKHSTTTGRHGTAGEVGGGIDAQSGSDRADEYDVREERAPGTGR